ncbi:MAG: pyrroline-5-carboxylate reductase [Candidatus Poribacteria bacterium]|nr:pyrroline-5-carboxylate reductase [Candidatus Poribacteria bacterium]
MDTKLRVGVIAVGNMGGAIVRGVASNLLPPEQVWITDIYQPAVDQLCNELGVNRAEDIPQLVENVDFLLYTAKPNNVPDIFPAIAATIQSPPQWLISIAAGVPIAQLESYFASPPPPIIRVMPNIAVSARAGIAAIASGSAATPDHLSVTQAIFNAVGKSLVMDEKNLDAVTGLSGSGPAFVCLFIEALADAGVQVGLARPDAYQLALQTVLGTSKMLEQTGEHPAVLKNRVTTPGGTTAAGLHELEHGRLRAIVADAVIAATKRAEALAN